MAKIMSFKSPRIEALAIAYGRARNQKRLAVEAMGKAKRELESLRCDELGVSWQERADAKATKRAARRRTRT